MAKKIRALAVVLFATVFLAAILASSPRADAAISIDPGSNISVVNKVPDFYAEGKGDAYTNTYMKVSPKGGYLNTGSTTITLTPWGYVTAEWTIGRVYVIFLVNVTETDFYIAYLYLTNSSTPMIVRLFEYKYATLKNFELSGVQYIFSRYTTTAAVEIPAIKFTPKAQPGNVISALGPELYINQNSGQLINGTSSWKIFPLFEQYFDGASDFNEVWSLFTDDSGGYYFGIFYAPNSDANHVLIEHQIRLNDYQNYEGKTFDATWTKKGFPYPLTVRLPQPSVVKVDGFPVKTDEQGMATINVPKASVTIEAPNEIDPSGETRWHFSSWDSFGNTNPLTLKVGSPLALSANYNQQYLLTIDSMYDVTGAGWYDQGTNVTFSAQNAIPSDNGTRRMFVAWDGDYVSTATVGTLSMTSPKHVTAVWKTQYDLRLRLVGVPSNTSAQVSVNGQDQAVSGSNPADIWIDSNAQVTIEVKSTQISGTDATYNFGELRIGDQTTGSSITVTGPLTIDLVYSTSSKSPSSIDLNVSGENAVPGQQLTFTGKVNTKQTPSTIALLYSSDNANWESLANISTTNDGSFSYAWKPEKAGTFFVRAYWSGNDNYTPSSSRIVSVHVLNGPAEDPGTAGNLPEFIRTIMEKVNGVPLAPPILALAGSLLTMGLTIGGLLAPGNAAMVGYFIGSLLIGLVFIFPISAIGLSLRAARNHRSPGVVWLIPLATIWVATSAMLLANGIVFFVPAVLLDAVLALLVLSNAIFVPLAVSVALARVVAG